MICGCALYSNKRDQINTLLANHILISKVLLCESTHTQSHSLRTEVLVIAPDDVVLMIKQSIGHLSSAVHLKRRNPGVILDKSLSFEDHVEQLFFHLRNISKLRSATFICSRIRNDHTCFYLFCKEEVEKEYTACKAGTDAYLPVSLVCAKLLK